MPAQRDIQLPVLRLAAWSAGAGWLAACGVGAVVGIALGAGPAEAIKAGVLAAAITMLGVAAGMMLVLRLGPSGSRVGFAILAGSLTRGLVLVAAGILVQYTLSPLPLALWVGLCAGWIAAKSAELRIVLGGGASGHMTAGQPAGQSDRA
jgi:hypothetical protein